MDYIKARKLITNHGYMTKQQIPGYDQGHPTNRVMFLFIKGWGSILGRETGIETSESKDQRDKDPSKIDIDQRTRNVEKNSDVG